MAVSDFYNGQCKLIRLMLQFGHDHGILFKQKMYSSNEKIVKMHRLTQKYNMLIKKESKLHICAAS